MKKAVKRAISFIITASLCLSLSLPAVAAGVPSNKEEVVYGILGNDGSVQKLYVVNIFDGGNLTDYGKYSQIQNLTSSEPITQNGDEITLSTTSKKLYYQGTLETRDLPWDIAIHYFLDVKETKAEDLGGKSGALKINIRIKKNEKINGAFFENFALQVGLQLDTKLCENIQAENATIAEAGRKKQITYTVLPGQGADYTVTSDVHDFEMDAITINGIKLNLGMTIDDKTFTGKIDELTDAIKALDEGAGELLTGVSRLSDGMKQYNAGLKAFAAGLSELESGTLRLSGGAGALKEGLAALTKNNAALINGALAIQNAAFDSVNAQLAAMNMGLPVLTPENYSVVLASIPDLEAVKVQLDSAVQFTAGLKGYLEGVAQLEAGAKNLSDGTAQLSASISKIPGAANSLYKASVELNSALDQLKDGLSAYKDGTGELRSGTADMKGEISRQIDDIISEMSGTGEEVTSFVSMKNTNISSVQFIIKTESITVPEEADTVIQTAVELGFWQKLLKLFGLYKES